MFRYFAYPTLGLLKLYYFSVEPATRSAAALPPSFDAFRTGAGAHVAQMRKLAAQYAGVDSVELWGRTPLQPLLQQLTYLVRLGLVSPAAAREALAALRSLIDDAYREVVDGYATGGARREVYVAEGHDCESVFTLRGPAMRLAVVTLDNPHYALGEGEGPFARYRRRFEANRRRSRPLFGPDPAARTRYFTGLRAAVDRAEREIGLAAAGLRAPAS